MSYVPLKHLQCILFWKSGQLASPQIAYNYNLAIWQTHISHLKSDFDGVKRKDGLLSHKKLV